jgi:hypothetical protein
MKRILCSLLVATLPFGSVLADAPKSKNAYGFVSWRPGAFLRFSRPLH